jgi:hypothetical protein
VGNLHGQGGMRMIGLMGTPQGQREPSPRCTDWCRQQGSAGHYATTDEEKARMSASIGDGLFRDGVVQRKFFPHVTEVLYREGLGYNAIADWAGYSHEEGFLAITGQLAHWASQG